MPKAAQSSGSKNTKACPYCCAENPMVARECTYCGYQFFRICMECGQPNSSSNIKCIKCGEDFKKYCPKCGWPNRLDAKTCESILAGGCDFVFWKEEDLVDLAGGEK